MASLGYGPTQGAAGKSGKGDDKGKGSALNYEPNRDSTPDKVEAVQMSRRRKLVHGLLVAEDVQLLDGIGASSRVVDKFEIALSSPRPTTTRKAKLLSLYSESTPRSRSLSILADVSTSWTWGTPRAMARL